MSFEAEPSEPAPQPPSGLLARLREDPVHAPEHIALAAADVHAAAAARWADERRAAGRYSPYALGEMARKRHASLASVSGAATGVGGLVTMIPDLVSLAWLQSRMVFFVAGAFGWDPFDPMRPAELLALTGLHHDPAAARATLDGLQGSSSVAAHWIGSRFHRDEKMASKLFVMVGKSAGKSIAGRMIPGFAIGYNARANRNETNKLGRRAVAFYSQVPQFTPAPPPR
jgi:hypothetical protein